MGGSDGMGCGRDEWVGWKGVEGICYVLFEEKIFIIFVNDDISFSFRGQVF